MTNLLCRLFIRDYRDTANAAVREAYGKLAGAVGIVTNLLLFAVKITVGLLFHSIAIMADAVNNLSDSASSIITLVGFKLSGKPADAKHPYGHERIEYISGLLISFVVLILGFQLAQPPFHGDDRLKHAQKRLPDRVGQGDVVHLLEIADAQVAVFVHHAAVGLHLPADDAHQRGLSAPVDAYQPHLLALLQAEGDLFEHLMGAEALLHFLC